MGAADMWKPVALTVGSAALSVASFMALLVGLQPRPAAASPARAPISAPAPRIAAPGSPLPLVQAGPGADVPSEAASMKAFVTSHALQDRYGVGKPLGPVVLEERSSSTDANLAEIQKLGAANGWRRMLLVTNQYHLPRVAFQADALGMA